jgi:hypothetical protein
MAVTKGPKLAMHGLKWQNNPQVLLRFNCSLSRPILLLPNSPCMTWKAEDRIVEEN